MKTFTIFTSIILYLISLYFIIAGFSIEYTEAKIFPQTMGTILIILTTVYFLKTLKNDKPFTGNLKRVTEVTIFAILYIIITPYVGYFITTPVMIFLIMFILGMKNIKILLLNPIIATLIIYLVFVKFFKIPVP